MDIVSHALWAAAAAEALRRRGTFARRDVIVAGAFGAMPDLVGLVPVSAWAIGSPEPWNVVAAYVAAVPGQEPSMAGWARQSEHVLHCSAHSLVVLAFVALLAWRQGAATRAALLGWTLHIALDVPTHSSAYYAVTLLYPLSEWRFDGLAWTSPAVLAANWILLAATGAALWLTRGGRRRGDRRAADVPPPRGRDGRDA